MIVPYSVMLWSQKCDYFYNAKHVRHPACSYFYYYYILYHLFEVRYSSPRHLHNYSLRMLLFCSNQPSMLWEYGAFLFCACLHSTNWTWSQHTKCLFFFVLSIFGWFYEHFWIQYLSPCVNFQLTRQHPLHTKIFL